MPSHTELSAKLANTGQKYGKGFCDLPEISRLIQSCIEVHVLGESWDI